MAVESIESVERVELTGLTQREQLIERILRMPANQVAVVEAFVEEMEDLLQDAVDLAIIEARKDEVGVPFDDVLNELGYTREGLEEIARAEGWMK